ncbi:MAG TPA: hypothetical protein VGJ91_04930 [Polyangiaceae bacterium]
MQADAKVWILSAALGACGCSANGTLAEPQRKSSPTAATSPDDSPFNVTPPSGGQSGRAGASSSAGSAGRAGGGTGGAGVGITGPSAGGTGASAGLAGGGSGAGGSGAGGSGAGRGGASGTSANSGAAGAGADATADCPSLTRVRLANGTCVERVTEFSVASNPTSIATGSDGRIWFDDGSGNQIVQLDDQGRILNRIPCDAGSTERQLLGGRGNTVLWYTDSRAKTLTSLNTALQRTPFDLGFAPSGLTLGEGDQLWLTEAGQAVYRLNENETSLLRFPAAPSDSIVLGPDKNLWFPEGVQIARLAASGEKQDFSITDSFADDLCPGPDGALWFTDGSLNQIGRMEADGTLSRTYDLPLNSKPFQIVVGPDGALWFTEQAAEKIGRISVKGVITHYPVPTSNSMPYAITVGPDHNLWFTETFSGKIGRLIPDPAK